MTNLEVLVKALDSAMWEMGEVFKDLPDEAVWERPHPRLLSIGELACHVTYWMGQSFLGGELNSPLSIKASGYYTANVEEPVRLDIGAEQVYGELKRVYDESRLVLMADLPSLDADHPVREGWKWGTLLEYQAFHFAYHTGQMYSIRHMMGHVTTDN